MRSLPIVLFSFLLASVAQAADASLPPKVQAMLGERQKLIAKWAAAPVIVAAVKAQNAIGPIPGMDNKKWAALPATDPTVTAFEQNAAGVWLAKKLAASKGRLTEAFLCGAKGEKVAFVSKPTSYLHAGAPKFDVPMGGQPWQGAPAFDESTQTESAQISTPVLDGDRVIGALVVGVAMKKPAGS